MGLKVECCGLHWNESSNENQGSRGQHPVGYSTGYSTGFSTWYVCKSVKLSIVFVPELKINRFSNVAAAQKGLKTIFTKAGWIIDLGSSWIQSTRSDNFDHLDLAIAKVSKRASSAYCAISRKTLCNEIVLTTSVQQKPIALSAVSMNIDQRALTNGSVKNNNDSSAYRIHDPTSTNKNSEVSWCEKDNPPSSMVDDVVKGRKSSEDPESVYDGIRAWKRRAWIVLETIVQ